MMNMENIHLLKSRKVIKYGITALLESIGKAIEKLYKLKR